jgi:hypothetical protein
MNGSADSVTPLMLLTLALVTHSTLVTSRHSITFSPDTLTSDNKPPTLLSSV